jgi:hypothetical protein
MTRPALHALWALGLGLGLCLCAAPPIAHAQPSKEPVPAQEPTDEELAAARELFNEALELEKKNKWEEALTRLQKVGQVRMTPQVRFHIALCHENLGRLVEAINGFELAEQEARAQGEAARAVAENAPERAAKLRERVARVRIVVTGEAHVSRIFLDGREVSLALVDTLIPVDPGNHRIEVRRSDTVTQEKKLALAEAETETVRLSIQDPAPPAPEPVPYPVPPPISPPPPEKPQPQPPAPDETERIPAYVVGGAGVLILVAAGVLWSLREDRIADVDCEDEERFRGCDPDDEGIVDEARTFDITSKVALGVGLAAVATGGVLWFVLAPDGGVGSFSSVGVAPTAGGLRVRGRF